MVVTGLLNPIGDCEFTGGFQARFGVLVAWPQNSQGRIVALFFYGYALEDPANHFCRIFPDGACPVPDAHIIPWRDTELVRHVLLVGRILVLPTGWEAVVGCDAGVPAVNLHGAVRDFQVYCFAGILIRAGIAVVFKHHMEVNVHFPAVYPCGNLIRNGRQGMEEGLLIQVSFIAAALPFLEAAVIKGLKFPQYGNL